MAKRTTEVVVRFLNAFVLPSFDKPQAAGDYLVEHDEEAIEGISHVAWRRNGSFIHVPAIGMQSHTRQIVSIDPADLDAALEKDKKIL